MREEARRFGTREGMLRALGILLDTFVVRTIMVPAAVEVIGDRVWWPSTPRGGRRALREADVEEQPSREATPVA